jgi:hypothetical protein
VPGANNEVSVNAALWGHLRYLATPDASVGTDDDALGLANGMQDFWDVFEGYLPGASSISMEDFWDGWFTPPYSKGHLTEMKAIFTARGIEYFDDAYEADDDDVQAKTVLAGAPSKHHTTYGVGDEDWAILALQGGSPYTFETLNLRSGADTRLDLFAQDATTSLAANDDRVSGDPSSFISYNATHVAHRLFAVPAPRRRAHLRLVGPARHRRAGTGRGERSVDRGRGGRHSLALACRAQRRLLALRDRARRPGQRPWDVLAGAPAVTDGVLYSYLDGGVQAGETFYYRIVGVETTGERQAFGPFAATAAVPARTALHAPQPNPFNPTTDDRLRTAARGAPGARHLHGRTASGCGRSSAARSWRRDRIRRSGMVATPPGARRFRRLSRSARGRWRVVRAPCSAGALTAGAARASRSESEASGLRGQGSARSGTNGRTRMARRWIAVAILVGVALQAGCGASTPASVLSATSCA